MERTLDAPPSPDRTLVDLFAGGGLFSWGFVQPRREGRAWRLALAVDRDEAATKCMRLNFLGSDIVSEDLASQDPKAWRTALGIRRGSLGLLHASPPCTDFSMVNRRGAQRNDTIFRLIFDWVETLNPAAVCIENVPSFRNAKAGAFHDEVLAKLRELGYTPKHFVLQAAEFGVPQFRRRLFYLAYRTDLRVSPRKPVPTHLSADCQVSVRDAIRGMPDRNAGDLSDVLSLETHKEMEHSWLLDT